VGCAAAAAHSLGLTPEERAVVNVHWVCSRSVVYVTSVLKPMGRIMSSEQTRRRRWRQSRKENDETERKRQQQLPGGTSLGSGSGFVVDSAGCVVTNYHVIQRAYDANRVIIQYDEFWNGLVVNATNRINAGEVEIIQRWWTICNG